MFYAMKYGHHHYKANDSLRVIYRVNSYILQLKGLVRDQCGRHNSKVSNSKICLEMLRRELCIYLAHVKRVRLLNVKFTPKTNRLNIFPNNSCTEICDHEDSSLKNKTKTKHTFSDGFETVYFDLNNSLSYSLTRMRTMNKNISDLLL